MRAINLKTEFMNNPMGIDMTCPFISWNDIDGIDQTAYEIQFQSDGSIFYTTGKFESSEMHFTYPGDAPQLHSKQKIEYAIRLWDEKDVVGEWSELNSFELGILEQDGFQAKWIDPELPKEELDPSKKQPVSYLRKHITLKPDQAEGKIRIYASARGLYEIKINGHRLGDFVLAPGTANYNYHMPYQTYDGFGMFLPGDNLIEVELADGWARSCSGVDGIRNLYGDRILFYMQVESNGELICITDESWEASQNGPLREADLQQGEVYDARLEGNIAEIISDENFHNESNENFQNESNKNFHKVSAVDLQVPFVAGDTLPVKEQEHFTGRLFKTPNGETVIDYGQNIAGYITFTLDAKAGQKLIIHHGESLDENGNFTNENFQDHNRHAEGTIQQRVEYICKDGENYYKSKFTIWGFRYGLIETDADLSGAKFEAIAVYSDMEETGSFECSNADVNQLVSNSKWSQKGNFCDIPTDCPTRERAGWTGDAGVFVGTGITLMNAYPVFRKWLRECRLTQKEDGRVYNISPQNGKISFFTDMLSGSVGWGDASIIVPYTMYKRSGNINILRENYEMMKGWYAYLESRAKGGACAGPAPTGGPSIPVGMIPEGMDPSKIPANKVPEGIDPSKIPAGMIPEGIDLSKIDLSKIDLSKYAGMMGGNPAAAGGQDNADGLSDYTIDQGTDYGEWCEPGVDSQAAMAAPSTIIATSFFARSGQMMAEIAYLLGDMAGAAHYHEVAEKAKLAYRKVGTENGRIHAKRQGDYVRALAFDLLDEEDAKQCAADLNQNVIDNDYHLSTGFLGTPNLCAMLCKYGYVDTAYKVLLQDTAPSWLYEVRKGATTIWETWDGIDAENKVHASLNHYSYGAITGWLISGLAGIQVEGQKLTIAPIPNPAMPKANAAYNSPIGMIRVSYEYVGDSVKYELDIPANAEARVLLPGRDEMVLKAGKYKF